MEEVVEEDDLRPVSLSQIDMMRECVMDAELCWEGVQD